MKILAMLAMVALAQMDFAGSPAGTAVTVCLGYSPEVGTRLLAKSLAGKMFAAVGVRIDWRSSRSCPVDSIRVEFLNSDESAHFRNALAYALPYDGTTIVVFYDRVQNCSICADLGGRNALLAHILVHEITHVLQGVAHHSSEGIMKPIFTMRDEAGMIFAPLCFTDIDLFLLQQGLAKRARQLSQ